MSSKEMWPEGWARDQERAEWWCVPTWHHFPNLRAQDTMAVPMFPTPSVLSVQVCLCHPPLG